MKIYAVGGSVRDEIIGRPVHDNDYVVVGSSIEEMLSFGYKQVGKDLKNGQCVLFCGTPCQVVGLRKYLDAEKIKINNLFCIDFICHGVPSEDLFHKYLEQFQKPKCTSII